MKTRTRVSSVILVAAMLCSNLGCATRRLHYTKGETDLCEVHHQKMSRSVVPVHYGLMKITPRDAALDSASTNAFPHAEDFVNPGCMVRGQREALVYTCPECVEARHKWEANYDSRH
jgi:hypothetical protein